MKLQYTFLLFSIALMVLVDGFLSKRWKLTKFGQTTFGKKTVQFWFVLVPPLSILGFGLSYLQIINSKEPNNYFGATWFLLAVSVIYFTKLVHALFISLDVVGETVTNRIPKQETNYYYPRLTRQKFLSQVGIVMATAPLVSKVFKVLPGRYAFHTRTVDLSFPNLPEVFNGLKVIQISDLHLGSFNNNRDALLEAIHLINAEEPDVILFTGDIVNNFSGELNGWEEYFKLLDAPMGKFSILGNHDYGNYSDWTSKAEKENNFNEIVEGHKRLGFTLLRNESVLISRDGATIGLGGVENWGLGRHPRKGDLELATKGLEEQPFNILMSHDPAHWDAKVLPQNFYDLTLSGHTHGMQFGIEKGNFHWSPAQYVTKRWAGLYREGDKFLYVNRGLGYLGMPARVGMPPEITLFKLRKGDLPETYSFSRN